MVVFLRYKSSGPQIGQGGSSRCILREKRFPHSRTRVCASHRPLTTSDCSTAIDDCHHYYRNAVLQTTLQSTPTSPQVKSTGAVELRPQSCSFTINGPLGENSLYRLYTPRAALQVELYFAATGENAPEGSQVPTPIVLSQRASSG